MKKTAIIFLFLFPLMLFLGCQDENDLLRQEINDQLGDQLTLSGSNSRLIDPGEIVIEFCEDPLEISLIAGRQQQFVGGTLEVGNNSDGDLFLIFTAAEGWDFSEIQLYVGDQAGIPTGKRGNPKIGKFGDIDFFNPVVPDATYMIPVDELVYEEDNEVQTTLIIAHAVIVQTIDDIVSQKSLFADWEDYEFSGPRWGGGFLYEFVECAEGSSAESTTEGEEVTNGEEPAGEESSGEEGETGDITDIMDLTSLTFTANSLDLVIKDLGEIQPAGNVQFYFEGDYLNVEYNLTITGWLISEVHINIGDLEDAIIGNNSNNPKVGLFTYVYHYEESEFNTSATYQIPIAELDPDFLDGGCETFTIHATLVDESDYTIQKSSFVDWDENLAFGGSKWGGSFLLCLESVNE